MFLKKVWLDSRLVESLFFFLYPKKNRYGTIAYPSRVKIPELFIFPANLFAAGVDEAHNIRLIKKQKLIITSDKPVSQIRIHPDYKVK